MNKIKIIPNVCTAANLLLGILALAYTLNHNYTVSVVLIALAALTDRIDGMLARRFDAESDFGKEFDSLADMVSFGVAPAALMYCSVVEKWSLAGLICFCTFILCGGVRLARYNVSGVSSFFQGVPITVCGTVLALIVLFIPNQIAVLITGFVLALAMVSKVRIPKI